MSHLEQLVQESTAFSAFIFFRESDCDFKWLQMGFPEVPEAITELLRQGYLIVNVIGIDAHGTVRWALDPKQAQASTEWLRRLWEMPDKRYMN